MRVANVAGDGSALLDVAWSRDGERLVTNTAASGVRVWEIGTWREGEALAGPGRSTRGLAAGPRGLLVGGSVGGTVIVWDMGQPVALGTRLDAGAHQVGPLALSPVGALLASVGGQRRITLWDARNRQRWRRRRSLQLPCSPSPSAMKAS